MEKPSNGYIVQCARHRGAGRQGVPGVYVASSAFKAAGEAQALALGYDPAVVFVRHPIQDRTDDEMRTIAKNAVDELRSCFGMMR